MLKDLTPAQAELAKYMSDVSEEAYCAVWMEGLEYALWEVVTGQRVEYGRLVLTEEHRMQLRRLSEACGGWVIFDDETEETWLSMAAWKRRFSVCSHENGPDSGTGN
jgi:hypothetical protein